MAKQAVQNAFARAAWPSAQGLFDIRDSYYHDPCPTCGFPKRDAAEKRLHVEVNCRILDRAGFGPHATLKVDQQELDPRDWMVNATDEELAELLDCMKRTRLKVEARLAAHSPLPAIDMDADDVLLLDEPDDQPGHTTDTSSAEISNTPASTNEIVGAEVCLTSVPDAAEVPHES